MDSEQDVSRRDFLRRLGALSIAGVGGGAVLAACDSSGSNDSGDGGGGRDIAQTFQVTVQEIDSSYPYSDQNNIGVAFAIGGAVGREITLDPGKTYEFDLQESVADGPNGAPHPFYIGQTPEGQGGDEFSDGAENAKSTSGSVFFTPPSDAPETLYYQCDNHVYMGGKMTIGSANASSNGDEY